MSGPAIVLLSTHNRAGRRIRLDLTVGVSRKLADTIFFWYESMVIITQWNQLRLLIGLVFPKQTL